MFNELDFLVGGFFDTIDALTEEIEEVNEMLEEEG